MTLHPLRFREGGGQFAELIKFHDRNGFVLK